MKFINNTKRFSVGIIVLWTTCCLAQNVNYPGTSTPYAPSPGASDQQIQAIDLSGKRGQQQVDAFTGSFGYSIPIACAPARNGSEPKLGLVYSSGGENGWCGVGWRLDIGYIERNTKDGFPIKYSGTPPAPANAYEDTNGFVLNLFGKDYKLLRTATANEYRPEVDTDFLRCVLDTSSNDKWTVYDKSGNVYYFGSASDGSSRVGNTKSGWNNINNNNYSATFRWALDQIDTPTGDRTTIAYTTFASPYTSGTQEKTIYPTQITYNNNYIAGSYNNTHTIIFGLEDPVQTPRPDYSFSYRWGFRTEQNRRLSSITCQAGGQNVCRYVLSYTASPATRRSLLHSVTVFGSDNTALPVQTFTYQANPNGVSFGGLIHWNGVTPPASGVETFLTEVWGGLGVADLIDMDGDGLPDWVVYDNNTHPNRYLHYRNLGTQSDGNGAFSTTAFAFAPTSTGNSSPSDSNPLPDGGFTSGENLNAFNCNNVRIRDINGDGLPDRVCDYWKYVSTKQVSDYNRFVVMTNYGSGFGPANATTWSPVDGGPSAGGDQYLYERIESGGVNTGFFDINGDGLPDRVESMYYTEGAMVNFRVRFNNGSGFGPIILFGPYRSQNWNNNSSSFNWAGIETPNVHVVDINGDGLPDRVMLPINPSGAPNPVLPQNRNQLMVEYNDGFSFEAVNPSTSVGGSADPWPIVNPSYPPDSGNDYYEIHMPPCVGLYDLNGDGLPDRVVLDESTADNNNTSKQWKVYLNNGHGFNTTPIITVQGIYDQSSQPGSLQYNDAGWWGMESSYHDNSVVALMDINGDGLPDRVMTVYGNNGTSYFLVQTNVGPFPDLLTGIDNGMGGTIGVSYKPSTAWNNLLDPNNPNSGSRMPFPRYTAAAVTLSDGVNAARTTSYSYAGGFYDGSRREFSGFAMVTITDPPSPSSSRKTVNYFHTGGGRNYSSLGEYSDPGNFAKRGMPYRTETYGNDNNLYKVTVNQVDQISLNSNGQYPSRYFPFVSLTFEYNYDYVSGTQTSPKITGSKYVYSTATGSAANDNLTERLTQEVLYGEISVSSLPNYTFSDSSSADTQYHQTHYAAISGRPDMIDYPDVESLTADANGNTVIQQTQYTYNSPSATVATKKHLICSSQNQYATTTYNTYNNYGLPTLITDPVGVQTSITYDGYNIYPYTTTVGPAGNTFTTTTTYDVRSGLLTESIDPMGVKVDNTYSDPFFRLTASTRTPVGGSAITMKTATYYLGAISSGNAVSYSDVVVNDGVGGVETRTYVDGFARPIQTITQGENSNYRAASTAYDERGNAFLTTWPQFVASVNFSKPSGTLPASFIGYDPAGRVNLNKRRVNASFNGTTGAYTGNSAPQQDSGSPLASKQWSYVFNNGSGNDPWWIICTDEDGKERRYGLDAFGRTNLIQEVSGGSTYATTTLSYDLAGNLTQIKNQNNEYIYYAYDAVGNLVAMADPYLGQLTYQRDVLGRLCVQTDARGNVVKLYYATAAGQDPLGRVQKKEVYSYNFSTLALTLFSTATYVYDSKDDGDAGFTVYKGLLYKVTDSQGYEKNGYDNLGRLIKTTRHLGINGQDYTTTYGYDSADHVASIGYPNFGPTINYSYWHGGSINKVSRNGDNYAYYTVNAANYDDFGHVTQFAYGNGVTISRDYTHYSNSRRLYSITSSVFNRYYTYSSGDDVNSLSGTGISGTMNATYDDLHRIHSYSGLGGGSIYYGYDSVGSITANIETGTAVTYGYGNARKQQVKSAFGYNYYYDLCGNMIVRHGGSTGSQAMDYDPENRLTRFSQAGMTVVEYGYTADGARLWKRVNQDPSQVQVWIGKIYEEKTDAQGQHILFHVYTGDQQVCTCEAGSALAVSGGDSGKIGYYYHEDSLNTSSTLSYGAGSQMGQQAEVNVYYPFGRTQTASPQAGFQVSRRFTGQVLDAESGLYYYNARYYDPELGRFIQADDRIPNLSNPQSYNRYSYVLNNPLRYTDPDGHGPKEWAQASFNFAGGTAIGFANVMNPIPSQFRNVPRASTTAESYGRQFGGNIAVTISTVEILGGGTLAGAGGTVEVVTAGGATLVAVPAVAVGGAVAVHGAVGINNWIDTTRKQSQGTTPGQGPNGGDRSPADQQRVDEARQARAEQREKKSRELNGQKPRGESTDHDQANKGPSGTRPKGPDTRDTRERNKGVDEEHSRVPKGSGGQPERTGGQ